VNIKVLSRAGDRDRGEFWDYSTFFPNKEPIVSHLLSLYLPVVTSTDVKMNWYYPK
jgi:hypothetical protein